MGAPARKNMNFFFMLTRVIRSCRVGRQIPREVSLQLSGVKLQPSGYLAQGSMIADQKSLQMK